MDIVVSLSISTSQNGQHATPYCAGKHHMHGSSGSMKKSIVAILTLARMTYTPWKRNQDVNGREDYDTEGNAWKDSNIYEAITPP